MTSLVAIQLAILFGLMFVFLFFKFPIFLCMLLASWGFSLIFPGTVPDTVFVQSIVSNIGNVNFTAICFYFLLGEIMNSGGLTDRLIKFCQSLIGHFRGSLSHINVIASMVFAGVSGSAMADTASEGAIIIPAMKKQGYPAGYAAAITECTSIIGPIIPPSTGLVLMGVYLGCSVRKLFLGGFIPGFIMTGFLLAVSVIVSYRRKFPKTSWQGWGYVFETAKTGLGALILPMIIAFFLVQGIGTVTEIGAVSCLLAIILAVIYKDMSWKKLGTILLNTTVIMGKVLCVLAGAGTFVWIIASLGVADWLAAQAMALGGSSTGVLLFISIMLFIIGMILDVGVIQMVIVPVLCPVILEVGIDPIHFGVLCMLICQMGLCTPPVGSLLYMVAGIAKCPALEVVKESLPFIGILCVLVILMIFFPQITLWLPNAVGA